MRKDITETLMRGRVYTYTAYIGTPHLSKRVKPSNGGGADCTGQRIYDVEA